MERMYYAFCLDKARLTSLSLDFEDTYDGLGDQLDETGDAFNDDTFGAGPATQQGVGKDFDFSGRTDNVARAIEEERMRFAAQKPAAKLQSPPKQAARPARSGYESYIPQLEADASIWGLPESKPDRPVHNLQASQASRNMLSLEEVEAEMRRIENLEKQAQSASQAQSVPQAQDFIHHHHHQAAGQFHQAFDHNQQYTYNAAPQLLQRPPQPILELPGSQPRQPTGPPAFPLQQPQILQRPRQDPLPPHGLPAQQQQQGHSPGPRHILQNPNRLSGPGQPLAHRQSGVRTSHQRGPSYNGPAIMNPQQMMNLSDEDRANFLQDQARRAKRHHKIHLLSKHNGLMTPQDKNFITRIQLQQLVTATGSLDAQGPEAELVEDFYYQVYAQIRGATRSNPHQPAGQFAHTYLFQTGGRYGQRRGQRHGDSHLARMEQQVARAVEAARARPKNQQLVIEGSLGKISYSNAKTPKPLLNITRPEHERTKGTTKARANDPAADRRVNLKNIENVYSTLMKLEDHERQMPPRLEPDSDPETIQRHMEWRERLSALNQKLWDDLKVHEALDPK